MMKKFVVTLSLFGALLSLSLFAQVVQNADRIKGTRFIPYPDYAGSPYLTDKFVRGTIEFTDGTKVENLGVRYSSYKDELIYYNPTLSAQIVIDKISLKQFLWTDNKGLKRTFRRLFFDSFVKEERFFEVLSEGPFDLLAYRKAELVPCDVTYNRYGMIFQPDYTYYLYAPGKGYTQVKIGRKSLLSKFVPYDQKQIKKLLRRAHSYIADEESFVQAWKIIQENGIRPVY